MTLRLTLLLLPLLLPCLLRGQIINTQFGKNRVQFHRDFETWSQYESENFITYWYGEGRFIGQAVVQIAEAEFTGVRDLLEHRVNEKIEIIVFVDLTDLKQSNIGSEEAFENATGQTKIVGNKMFVHYDGNQEHLRMQVREGIASVFLNAMWFGSNLQEIVQNAVLLNLPPWFKDGLASYCGQEWSVKLDDQMRDIFAEARYKNFEKFASQYPKLAGHSMWYYIAQNYGKPTVSQLLYLTRINRSIENGFQNVLGLPFENVAESWDLYYQKRFEREQGEFQTPEGQLLPLRKKLQRLPLSQLKISPDASKVAFTSNEIGRTSVYVQDVATGARTLVYRGGVRNSIQATDYNYPLIAWHPGGQQLSILYEKRDVIYLLQYDLNTRAKVVEPLDPQFQRAYAFDYLDHSTLVLSGTVRGFADLFFYFPVTRQTVRITQDPWDDLDVTVVNLRDRKGVIFASNRPDTLLRPVSVDTISPKGNLDLFYLDLDNRGTELVRITHTPDVSEICPAGIDTTWYAYASEESGIYNRQTGYLEDYVAQYDKVIVLNDGQEIILHPDSSLATLDSTLVDTTFLRPVMRQRGVNHFQTNYDRNLLSTDVASGTRIFAEAIKKNGRYEIRTGQLDPTFVNVPKPTRYLVLKIRSRKEEEIPQLREEVGKVLPPILKNPFVKPDTAAPKAPVNENYFFQSPFPELTPAQTRDTIRATDFVVPEFLTKREDDDTAPSQTIAGLAHKFRPARIIPYRLKFRTDFVNTNLDNDILFEGLNSFAGTPNQFQLPTPGILLKANFKELMEDYQIEGGVRVPTTFNGAEYFLYLDDKKHRLDKRYGLYYRNQRYQDDNRTLDPVRQEGMTFIGLTQLRYPLDIYQSLRLTPTLRIDRLTTLSTDATTLETPTIREQRLGLKLEYVYDNTLDLSLNIKNGTRYKAYAEVVKRLAIDLSGGASVDFGQGFMGTLGIDARHYQRVLKYSVLAGRLAGATSFGSEKILFFLGGVENWLFAKFDNSTPLPTSGDFAYQTIAANLRGFRMNIRNGNSFALTNVELRVPMFRYFFPRTQSTFVKNFQVVGFFDAGTAWQGFSPFRKDNPLNTVILPEGGVPGRDPVVIKVNYFRDPIVAGYGVGARVLLMGYLLRLDYAWGIETRQVQKPTLYFSMGTDF
jgi:hypothetical protein